MGREQGDSTMQFHVLAFEGPDAYAQAGGIASRITGLTQALAAAGFATHLWFVGDPTLPSYERQGQLHLHRWCQWISRYHPGGVYDGEDGKQTDYAASLPPFLCREVLLPSLQRGERAVILAEEWHTVHAVLHLDWLLRLAGWREQVTILWKANNIFGFDRIDWHRLSTAATLTTVSRYMKHLMRRFGVDPLVMPNGLPPEAIAPPEPAAVAAFRQQLRGRTVLSKVARWDPDKQWVLTIEIVKTLKQQGWQPLLVARGGVEAHGAEVLQAAREASLSVVERYLTQAGPSGLLQILDSAHTVDVVSIRSPLDPSSRRVLFRGSAAVLANSGHEPFGLVGLEAMAVGGLACTGATGEDYVLAGQNALVLETANPQEFISLFEGLRATPARERALRQAAQSTARRFAWPHIIQSILLPRLQLLARVSSLSHLHRTDTACQAA
jgi:glycosyltransferase involved in cell wall biosynthesis